MVYSCTCTDRSTPYRTGFARGSVLAQLRYTRDAIKSCVIDVSLFDREQRRKTGLGPVAVTMVTVGMPVVSVIVVSITTARVV